MSQRLHEQLEHSVGEPPRDLDPARLLASAGRHQLRHRVLASVAGMGCLAALAGVGRPLLHHQGASSKSSLAAPADATAGGSASADSDDLPCPTASPSAPGSGVSVTDYVDMVRWNGHSYTAQARAMASSTRTSSAGPVLGNTVGTVRCSIEEISAGGTRRVSYPWPDGTATALSRGTELYAVSGSQADCLLAARVNGVVTLYRSDASGCQG